MLDLNDQFKEACNPIEKTSDSLFITGKAGIYQIRNIMNNKVYVGSSVSLKDRWRGHRLNLNKNQHPSTHLQWAWNKYGEKSFVFEILEIVADTNNLLKREYFWIKSTKCYQRMFGYNSRIIPNSNLGLKLPVSKTTRLKIAAKLIGNKNGLGHTKSNYAIAKSSERMMGNKLGVGRKMPKEHQARLIALRIGSKHTDETRRVISEKVSAYYANPENLKKHSLRMFAYQARKREAARRLTA
jgi:group I intron endonuclease